MEIQGNPWKSMEKYKIDITKFNLLPNERLESFWDALWPGIRTFLCFKMSNWSQLGVNFNDFINCSGHFGIDLGSFGGHFGVVFGIWGGFEALSEPISTSKCVRWQV